MFMIIANKASISIFSPLELVVVVLFLILMLKGIFSRKSHANQFFPITLNVREFVESIEAGNANDGEKKTFNWCLQNNVKDMGLYQLVPYVNGGQKVRINGAELLYKLDAMPCACNIVLRDENKF